MIVRLKLGGPTTPENGQQETTSPSATGLPESEDDLNLTYSSPPPARVSTTSSSSRKVTPKLNTFYVSPPQFTSHQAKLLKQTLAQQSKLENRPPPSKEYLKSIDDRTKDVLVVPQPEPESDDEGKDQLEDDVAKSEESEDNLDEDYVLEDRESCDICRQGAGDVLIENARMHARKAPAKSIPKIEARIDEYDQLGAWVRCKTCICVFHFNCSSTESQRYIISQIRSSNNNNSNTPADQSVGTRIILDRCVYCRDIVDKNCPVCYQKLDPDSSDNDKTGATVTQSITFNNDNKNDKANHFPFLHNLLELGFPKGKAKLAIRSTNFSNIDAALDWLQDNPEPLLEDEIEEALNSAPVASTSSSNIKINAGPSTSSSQNKDSNKQDQQHTRAPATDENDDIVIDLTSDNNNNNNNSNSNKPQQNGKGKGKGKEKDIGDTDVTVVDSQKPVQDNDITIIDSTSDNKSQEKGKGKEKEKPVQDQDSPHTSEQKDEEEENVKPKLFRCYRCKMAYHGPCIVQIDSKGQFEDDWLCVQCRNIPKNDKIDIILAWRLTAYASPAKSSEETFPEMKNPSYPAEYLVKWQNRSYRHLEWVSHNFIFYHQAAKLRYFLSRKTFTNLTTGETEFESSNSLSQLPLKFRRIDSFPDAADHIPIEWKIPEVILDVRIKFQNVTRKYHQIYRKINSSPEDSVCLVQHALIKWRGLPYSEATWDDRFDKQSLGYDAFFEAYVRFIIRRQVSIPHLNPYQLQDLDRKKIKHFEEISAQPAFLNKKFKLRDFQIEGVNWLYYNWCHRQSVILADEMGLGKTVQIVAFVSLLFKKERKFPFLIVVPNSTLDNWMREFERWAPQNLTVAPLSGDKASRNLQIEYMITNPQTTKNEDNPIFMSHVIIATYQSVVSESLLLRRAQRFETLIVDEGHRLKSGQTSQLATSLRKLHVGQRIILTGTPLNNNISELLNLLSFLQPQRYDDMRVEYQDRDLENISAEDVKKFHEILHPVLLRRTKAILDLPPIVQITVPLTMTALQKEIYKGILTRNFNIFKSIFGKGNNSANKVADKTNILMELRKCLLHPYLVDLSLDQTHLDPHVVHQRLIDASCKLVILSKMLPQLIAKGHRMLVFTQFVMNLDILEDFLNGEGIKYFRIDGNTSQTDRQNKLDQFNREGSDVPVFILSTRAGGLGINLFTADTVIINDVDWNPQQDLQAIARAHRIGQKKKVMVFKLLVKNSAEEKMWSIGKSKLVLDHLLIQNMSVENQEKDDLDSIIKFGAKTLFEEGDNEEAKNVTYSDQDVKELIERTENDPGTTSSSTETDNEDKQKTRENLAFAYARVWEGKSHEVMVDDNSESEGENVEDARGFWERIIEEHTRKQVEEEEKAANEQSNHLIVQGKRKRKQVRQSLNLNDDELDNERDPRKKRKEDGDAEFVPDPESNMYIDDEPDSQGDENEVLDLVTSDKSKKPIAPTPAPAPPAPSHVTIKYVRRSYVAPHKVFENKRPQLSLFPGSDFIVLPTPTRSNRFFPFDDVSGPAVLIRASHEDLRPLKKSEDPCITCARRSKEAFDAGGSQVITPANHPCNVPESPYFSFEGDGNTDFNQDASFYPFNSIIGPSIISQTSPLMNPPVDECINKCHYNRSRAGKDMIVPSEHDCIMPQSAYYKSKHPNSPRDTFKLLKEKVHVELRKLINNSSFQSSTVKTQWESVLTSLDEAENKQSLEKGYQTFVNFMTLCRYFLELPEKLGRTTQEFPQPSGPEPASSSNIINETGTPSSVNPGAVPTAAAPIQNPVQIQTLI